MRAQARDGPQNTQLVLGNGILNLVNFLISEHSHMV